MHLHGLEVLDIKKELKSQCRGRVQGDSSKRESLKHKPFYWNPFSRGVPFNFTAKEVILSGESSLMCCKSWESRRSIVETVTSVQEVSALHNISPRTVAENQTELESSGRPGDRSRSKSVKDIKERQLL